MWIILHLNPEPWAIGQLSVGRANGKAFPRIGRNPQLAAYQEAVSSGVRDYLEHEYGLTGDQALIDGPVDLRFYFWRRMDTYKSVQARTVRKHEVDATNCQKSTEDALHGIFFLDDKNDKHVQSTMVVQNHVTEPCILINVQPYEENLSMIPPVLLQQVYTPPPSTARTIPLADRPVDSEYF